MRLAFSDMAFYPRNPIFQRKINAPLFLLSFIAPWEFVKVHCHPVIYGRASEEKGEKMACAQWEANNKEIQLKIEPAKMLLS